MLKVTHRKLYCTKITEMKKKKLTLKLPYFIFKLFSFKVCLESLHCIFHLLPLRNKASQSC